MELLNSKGFVPEGKALKLWTLLPQISTTIGDEEIPPLFGNIKNLSLYYFLFFLLIVLESVLVFYLNNEGVPIIVLIALSAVDFAVACLPYLYELKPQYNRKLNDANILIEKTKLAIASKVPARYNGNNDNHLDATRQSLEKFKKQNTVTFWIGMFFSSIIVLLGAVKFYSYYGIFGSDILVEPVGRFIIITILISIVVHIFCTKVVLYNELYKRAMKSQHREFSGQYNKFRLGDNDLNLNYSLNFLVPYTPIVAQNQRVCQEYDAGKDAGKPFVELNSNGQLKKYKTQEITGNDNVYLLHTGILLESEINKLSLAQHNDDAKKAVAVSGKQVQIGQI